MRKLMFWLILAPMLWGMYWGFGSNAIRNGVDGFFADAKAQGLVAEKTDLTVTGFPNRWDVTVDGLRLADLRSEVAWTAPFLQVFAMTWKPWHIIAAFPPDQQVSLPGQKIDIASEGLKASVRARPATDVPLAAIVLEANRLTATSSTGWTLGTGRSVISLSADEAVTGAGDAPNTYLFATDLAGVTPDPAFLAAVKSVTIPDLPPSDLPDTIETLRSGVYLTFTAPLDRHAGETKPLLTRIDISQFAFAWGPLSATAKGQVQADDQGYAAGEITVDITNWNRLPALLVAAGAITPEAAPTVARGLQALAAQSDVLTLKLTLAEGQMSFGPFPLGPAPQMLPPSG